MEDDTISADEATVIHKALYEGIQQVLNNVIPTLEFKNITQEEIKNLTVMIQNKVGGAIQNQQNFLKDLSSLINGDNIIGTAVFKFSGDQLLKQNSTSLNERWTNNNGDWELLGSVNTVEH